MDSGKKISLTPTESRVLGAMLRGANGDEGISKECGISVNTTGVHVWHIMGKFKKVGISNLCRRGDMVDYIKANPGILQTLEFNPAASPNRIRKGSKTKLTPIEKLIIHLLLSSEKEVEKLADASNITLRAARYSIIASTFNIALEVVPFHVFNIKKKLRVSTLRELKNRCAEHPEEYKLPESNAGSALA
jgi:DNA-binding CsgD family transcriptional regulator